MVVFPVVSTVFGVRFVHQTPIEAWKCRPAVSHSLSVQLTWLNLPAYRLKTWNESKKKGNCAAILVYCLVRDWVRFCYVIGLDSPSTCTLSDSLWSYFFSTVESGFKNIRIRCRISRIRVDGSRIRKEKVADSKISGYVWTGPLRVPGYLYTSNNQRLQSAGDNDRRSKRSSFNVVLCASFTWQMVKSARDQISSDRRSRRAWSNCVLCIPYILRGSPNDRLREHPYFSALVSSFTRREKPSANMNDKMISVTYNRLFWC